MKSKINIFFSQVRKRYVALTFFLVGVSASLFFYWMEWHPSATQYPSIAQRNGISSDNLDSIDIRRLNGFKNIQPVISVERMKESEGLSGIKLSLEELIGNMKKEGLANQVSVYFRNTANAEWLSINGDERYHPASLMKVPLMLAMLKMAEENPGLLKQTMVYQPEPNLPFEKQFFQDKSIEPGTSYSVHDLIFYSIAYSDNSATQLLSKHVDVSKASSLFGALGLKAPDPKDPDYSLSVKEYSMFIKSIFNSTFLSPEYSDYGADMMANCNFKEGFKKGFPEGTKMWHKFGEWSKPGTDSELHESGVVFIGDKPYILTVMTRGKEQKQLATVIQKIAANVSSSHLP